MLNKILSIAFLLFTVSAFSQSDAVYLKNGNIIRGRIINRNATNLRIRINGGSEYVFTIVSIDSVAVNRELRKVAVIKPPVNNTVGADSVVIYYDEQKREETREKFYGEMHLREGYRIIYSPN